MLSKIKETVVITKLQQQEAFNMLAKISGMLQRNYTPENKVKYLNELLDDYETTNKILLPRKRNYTFEQ